MIRFRAKALQHWQTIDESWRFAVAAFLITRLFYALWSWVILETQPVAVQNLSLSAQPLASIFSAAENAGYVYLRSANGQVLSFQAADRRTMVDQQTGSIWNISTGIAEQGPLRNSRLTVAPNVDDIFPYFGAAHYPGGWLSMWQRYDANWYVTLAGHGYGSIPGDDHFPPLFPLLIRVFTPLFGNAFLAGLFVAHAATLFSLKLLYDTFSQWGDGPTARRAILIFLLYPAFFFFFSAYSEPVFLLTALLALRAMQNGRWAWAGFWIFCAILTRLQGAALLAPMLYWMWKDRPILRNTEHGIGLFVASLGGIFYLYFRSTLVTGAAVPFAEAVWRARLVPPWETYWYAVRTMLSGDARFIDLLNLFVMTLFLILLGWGWKKLPLEYDLYTACSILIILVRMVEGQPLISMSRYSLTLFPTFYALSLVAENSGLRRVILYTSIVLSLYLSGQFFLWGWVA